MSNVKTHRWDDDYRNGKDIEKLQDEIDELMDRLHVVMRRYLWEGRGLNATLIVSAHDQLTGYSLANYRTVGDAHATATVARAFAKRMED